MLALSRYSLFLYLLKVLVGDLFVRRWFAPASLFVVNLDSTLLHRARCILLLVNVAALSLWTGRGGLVASRWLLVVVRLGASAENGRLLV